MLHMKNNELGQFIPMHYHYQMLTDDFRMEAFKNAIKKVVKPNDNVVELGSGTGIMSFLAAKQGANVWAVEFNPTLAAASRKFIKDNELSDRVKVINGDASTWLPPEPADVVICEMLHSALLREKQIQVIEAFRDSHYKRFGKIPVMIPNATILAVQPVYQKYDFYGYYAPVSLFQSPYHKDDNIFEVDPQVYKIVDYSESNNDTYDSDIYFNFKKDTSVNAIKFITKSLLSMDFYTGETVDWYSQNLVLPLYETLEIKENQIMNLNFSYNPGDSIEKLNNSINYGVVESVEKLKLVMSA
ncbi:MAG: methyltransferase domain-containing protein [Clostridiales bacterium]